MTVSTPYNPEARLQQEQRWPAWTLGDVRWAEKIKAEKLRRKLVQ
tara:strand:- start:101 stop:235 length:135 start_codon:yes stop_codon:yes gene_type:complete